VFRFAWLTVFIEPSLTWADPYLYLGIIADYACAKWQPPTLPPSEALDPLIGLVKKNRKTADFRLTRSSG